MFEDNQAFDPARDGKVPLKRTPLALCLRFFSSLARQLFSTHPSDAFRWLWSLHARRQPLSYVLPWLTFDAIRELERRTKQGQRVFEFGSGHSSVYWAQRGLELHSVEDSADWYHMVRERLAEYPAAHLYLEQSEARYVGRLLATPGLFDLILVDGAFRLACVAAAIAKIAPGGTLAVDNTDWHWFADVDELIPLTWHKEVFQGAAPFIGHSSQTTLWRRMD